VRKGETVDWATVINNDPDDSEFGIETDQFVVGLVIKGANFSSPACRFKVISAGKGGGLEISTP
jgi:hypothetical protein